MSSIEARAKSMSISALEWSRKDAREAAEMAERLERAGVRTLKSGGQYRDEACIYATELKRRGVSI